MENANKNPYLIPASIIVAGFLIAFAVIYTSGVPGLGGGGAENESETPSIAAGMRPVDSSDHILGNPDAPIKIVEYSDLECPFCKTFHPTLKRIIDEYGKDGKVAWVYRHFPLDSIHPKARKEAEASECAAELGGNSAFWAYIGKVFEVTPSNNHLDPAQLPVIAAGLGLERAKFEACLASGKYAQRVARDLEDAINAGGDGTPYSVIVANNGKMIPFSGALQYAQVKPLLDDVIAGL